MAYTEVMNRPPPPPREFPFSAAPFGIRFLLLFGGIWAPVGVIVTVVFSAVGGPPWADWVLDSRGVTAQASYVDARPTSARVNGRTQYELTVRAEDTELHVRTTDFGLVDRAKAGQPVTVTWDRQDPTLARLDGERASFFGPFILIPGFFAVSGVVLVVLALTRLTRLRAIYRDGEAAQAAVVAVESTSMRVNGRPMFRAKYEFRAGVETVSGSYLTPNPPNAGGELWVLYVPGAPSKNTPFTT